MARKDLTDKEKVLDSLRLIREARPETDKKHVRPKENRKPYVRRKADGTWNIGGWRGSPNSLAALELHRTRTQFGRGQRRCACGQPAVKGSDGCRWHEGKRKLSARKKADHAWKPKRKNVMRRELRRLAHEGAIPFDLVQVPAFRAVLDTALAPADRLSPRGTEQRSAEIRERDAAVAVALQFIHAWHVLVDHDDHQPWQAALAAAREAGL